MAFPPHKDHDLRIIIAGGSLSALFTALTLRSHPNINSITILEKHPPQRLQDQGAGIRLGPEVVSTILQYTGTGPDDYTTPMNRFRILDEDGTYLVDREVVSYATSWGQMARVLRRALDEGGGSGGRDGEDGKEGGKMAEVTYRNAVRVSGLVDRGDVVEVSYEEDGKTGTMNADIVVGADGASSTVRHIVAPEATRSYAGYVIERGMVPVEELSKEALEVFNDSGVFSWTRDSSTIMYPIPSNDDFPKKKQKVLNWGWYEKKSEQELETLMTGVDGNTYEYSLPLGMMKTQEAEKIRQRSADLSPFMAEAILKTKDPFVQVITDNIASENVFMGGKVLLVGDAVAGQRPHVASATTQSAFHALLLRALFDGQVTLEEWSRESQTFAQKLVDVGRIQGDICLDTTIDPVEKGQQHVKLLMSTFGELMGRWQDLLGKPETKQ